MDIAAFLAQLCALPGVPGMEGAVAERVAKEFSLYSDDVRMDPLGNVLAAVGDTQGPVVLISAHMDEIGLIVTDFDERGGVKFASMGGVDPRILPGLEVVIRSREGDLYGVIGAKPPHLSAGAQKAPKMHELAVDTGYSAQKIREMVRIGDPITFKGPLIKLANGRIACKTLDDRACVAALAVAMEELKDTQLRCRAIFCGTIAEEVGCRGAAVAAYGVDPDIAIALDVTHGPNPEVDASEVTPLDCVALCKGPLLHPAVGKRLEQAAEQCGVRTDVEIASARTGTDADMLQIARDGIPTGLISIPLSYMHTTVELIQEKTVREAGRLLAQFLKGVGADWGEWLC